MREADREALIEAGASVPAPESVRALYREAFERFDTRALWSSQLREAPTVAQVLAMTRRLRLEGDMAARRLAAETEQGCRAAV